MKKLFTFFLGAVVSNSFCQSVSVKEANEKFSNGSHDAIIANIFENNMDEVISQWKKLLKDYKNEKVKDKDNEVFGDNILIKDWGNNPVDFYARFEENAKEKNIKIMVAVDLGGKYLSSSGDKEKHKLVEKIIKDFAIKMTKEPLEAAVKAANKVLDKHEDNQKDLEKENKNLKSDIENYKAKIKKAEEDTKKNEESQVKKKSEIEAQKKAVDELKKKLDKVN
jgi:hypothetical protein